MWAHPFIGLRLYPSPSPFPPAVPPTRLLAPRPRRVPCPSSAPPPQLLAGLVSPWSGRRGVGGKGEGRLRHPASCPCCYLTLPTGDSFWLSCVTALAPPPHSPAHFDSPRPRPAPLFLPRPLLSPLVSLLLSCSRSPPRPSALHGGAKGACLSCNISGYRGARSGKYPPPIQLLPAVLCPPPRSPFAPTHTPPLPPLWASLPQR